MAKAGYKKEVIWAYSWFIMAEKRELGAHLLNCKQKEEEHTGNGIGFGNFIAHPPGAYFLQQGHTP